MWILLLALLAQDFEAIGRVQPVREDAQAALASGLGDSNERTRAGAARGFEALFRLNKGMRPVPAALTGLHAAFSANRNEEIRELILMAMNTVQDRDAATLALALKDPSPQVRRLAVLGTGKWIADPSPIVQYAALKADPTCDRAAAAVANPNGHVVLLAIDLLGKQKCDAKLIAPLLTSQNWRTRAHALLSMAAVDPVQARRVLRKSEANPVWQVRAYAAKAAIILNDSEALATLARDPNPNVAIEAMTTFDAAVRALSSDHSGLIRAGANKLKDAPDLNMFLPQLVAAYRRLTGEGVITRRDPRVELLNRIGEVNDPSTTALLRAALHDQDPKIAALAVATFVQLAEAGMYNGLTFHRIVPNFVIQGGSPGADEYDALSRYFMPDELGVARNARGTVGISTRGRDTGDAQIYFNLVDNFHLDRNYTVFAATREGLDVMDRVQEGDVIEKIEIIRARR
jgi:cyclophilin family peptidyl-prolyl cis-trans isomerase